MPIAGLPSNIAPAARIDDYLPSPLDCSPKDLARFEAELLLDRRDLAVRFGPAPNIDRAALYAWLLTFGAREIGVRGAWRTLFERQWAETLRDQPALRRIEIRGLLLKMQAACMAADARRDHAPAPKAAHWRTHLSGSWGVNIVGHFESPAGLGESARRAIATARHAGVPVGRNPLPGGPPTTDSAAHFLNLIHVNAADMLAAARGGVRFGVPGRVNVGYWVWELAEFPRAGRPAFDLCDEIWTPSGFCQSTLSELSPIPVVRMPHSIDVRVPAGVGRDAFAIRPDEFVVLAFCDMLSVFERKNPLAAVAAFRSAFDNDPSARLLIKVSNSAADPEGLRSLREAARGARVTLINEALPREIVNALIESADCLLSLHRSEGFGLTLAEAMHLGKPAVATGYSGNLDFMTDSNSLLVDYSMVAVPHGCAPYRPGAAWAEPDALHAARCLEALRSDSGLRATLGRRARETIEKDFSPAAVGNRMNRRLEMLWAMSHRDAAKPAAPQQQPSMAEPRA